MRPMQSPPLLRVILLGFFIVALPLVGAIVTAIARVDRLAEDSGRALVEVQKNTVTSNLLVDRVVEMERSARQYQAIGDISYKQLYEEHQREVITLIGQLQVVDSAPGLREQIAQTVQAEVTAQNLVTKVADGIDADELEATFRVLREGALEISREYDAAAQRISHAIPEEAGQLQRLLVGQAAWVIPLSALLAGLFVMLIARPLSQLDQGIRSLGRGVLTDPIRVYGSRDLVELGRQLDLLRTRLIELEAQKIRFLRNVSHELKTPLTNVREAAELLSHTNQRTDLLEQSTIVQILKENSLRLQRMIEELLHYGTDADIKESKADETVQLDKLVTDALKKNELAATTRSIELRANLSSATVTGNTKQLGIIVDNLLSNALNYTSYGGEINVDLKCSENSINLDVCDNGPGISANDKEHIFEWFFTGAKPKDSIMVSTGMGLAISQEYAIQQGGEIRLIESEQGAHFRLTLRKPNETLSQ